MNGLIQGSNAVVSILKNDFVPFLCASDISVTLTTDEILVRTVKAGHWKKRTYGIAEWSVSLSGLLKFDDETAFTSWDMIDNWLNFSAITIRIAFTDDQSNLRSIQGEVLVKDNSLSWSPGALVKTALTLPGTGELMVFDGLIPCPSTILSITATEATDDSGDATFTYTYSGAPYQVKYRVDNTGNYAYALIDASFTILSGTVGAHSIEIIPVCLNSYEGTGLVYDYNLTHNYTCSSVITNITVGALTVSPIYTGTPSIYKYRFDGGAWNNKIITGFVITTGLNVGSHTVEMVPICANGVEGVGFTKAFTVASQPAQSIINYNFGSFVSGNTFQIYVNGVLTVNISTGGTSSIVVPTGATVKGVLQANNNSGSHATLRTDDTTLGSVLDTQNYIAPATRQYSFVTNGDTYSINATVTP